MIFQPVLNVFLLILLFAPVAALAVWMLVRGQRALWSMRLVMLLAVFVMLLRPGIPGGATQTLATDTDIVIVLDTTASMVAEDWDGEHPRLDGVRADVQSIVDEYPGARFALITFAAAAEQRLPLTTDTTALMSSLEILRPEVTSQSRGSSIGIANTMLQETLAGAAESAPDRSRMVFYLGDGEQTVTTEPESFSGERRVRRRRRRARLRHERGRPDEDHFGQLRRRRGRIHRVSGRAGDVGARRHQSASHRR